MFDVNSFGPSWCGDHVTVMWLGQNLTSLKWWRHLLTKDFNLSTFNFHAMSYITLNLFWPCFIITFIWNKSHNSEKLNTHHSMYVTTQIFYRKEHIRDSGDNWGGGALESFSLSPAAVSHWRLRPFPLLHPSSSPPVIIATRSHYRSHSTLLQVGGLITPEEILDMMVKMRSNCNFKKTTNGDDRN